MPEGYISLAMGSRSGPCGEGPESIRQLIPAILSGKPNPQRNSPQNKYHPKLV